MLTYTVSFFVLLGSIETRLSLLAGGNHISGRHRDRGREAEDEKERQQDELFHGVQDLYI